MENSLLTRCGAMLSPLSAKAPAGRITDIGGAALRARGLAEHVRLGDRVVVWRMNGPLAAEVIRLEDQTVALLPDAVAEGVGLHDPVSLCPPLRFAPDLDWIGRVIDPDGRPLDGQPLLAEAGEGRNLRALPPPAQMRRGLGARLATGYAVFDTLLPLVRGQRIGLFAGSGVGKSTLLAGLARQLAADVIVIGLVGERGRELGHFLQEALGPEGMARAVVVAATSDLAPQVRRRCALTATAVAEHFRDQGLHVLLLVDSVTRFAEAHREVALAAGEAASLRGFPPSTASSIAALCERAGPGADDVPTASGRPQGDITAVYTVLVAGSDMEEPVADMLRGVLDGHVVLDRAIAEGGRFPAVDVLRSVSRALPQAANPFENQLIGEARAHLSRYDRAAMMIRAGLYVAGSDPQVDAAIAVQPELEAFLAQTGLRDPDASFLALRKALAPAARRGPSR